MEPKVAQHLLVWVVDLAPRSLPEAVDCPRPDPGGVGGHQWTADELGRPGSQAFDGNRHDTPIGAVDPDGSEIDLIELEGFPTDLAGGFLEGRRRCQAPQGEQRRRALTDLGGEVKPRLVLG